MYLVFDAKHFGTPRPELPLEHHSQPIVFQFCGIVYDHNGTELDVVCAPEPATSEPTDLTITEPRNEITAAQRRRDYVPPTQVFSWFKRWADQCEIIVGHNAHFDLHAMRALGAAMLGIDWIPKAAIYCTMINAAPVLNLPSEPRIGSPAGLRPRAPSLAECMRDLFDEELPDRRDGLEAVRACNKVFRELSGLTGAKERRSGC